MLSSATTDFARSCAPMVARDGVLQRRRAPSTRGAPGARPAGWARGCATLALLVLGAIAVLALVELARLLSGVRATEIELLWSRGAAPARIAATTAAEAAAVAAIGALAGTGGALGALAIAGSGISIENTRSGALGRSPRHRARQHGRLLALRVRGRPARSARRDTGPQSGRTRIDR